MKKQRILFIIALSAISLLGLVVMQINWMLHAANLREEQLGHRITMALHRINQKIKRDTLICQNIKSELKCNNGKCLAVSAGNRSTKSLDSIVKSEFHSHHITVSYSFQILDKSSKEYKAACYAANNRDMYTTCLDGLFSGHQKAELRFRFFNKQQYIYAEMGSMLLGSVVLIAGVLACFILTIQMILKQKKLSEMTGDFINNMTHELKTPIATISLASNMIRKEQIVNNPLKINHYAEVIHEENDKLQLQVEQVLRIARIERGEFTLNKCNIDINELIKDAINSIELQVYERGGQIRCYLNAAKNEILADANHITNVISNLLDNANKYSPENPNITITTQDRINGLLIAVEDKGIGMSKDKQKFVFQKFYRVPTGNLHDVKGYGLGLAYVKMMVDAHKGQVVLHSELGKGSKFEIFLPYQV